jgi:hypothetical protein
MSGLLAVKLRAELSHGLNGAAAFGTKEVFSPERCITSLGAQIFVVVGEFDKLGHLGLLGYPIHLQTPSGEAMLGPLASGTWPVGVKGGSE